MKRQIIVVYNRKSGSALPARELRALFASAGFDIVKTLPVSDSLRRQLAPYIEMGTYIAAVGGDGTISTVAGLVAGTEATLVPIPGGTLNNFTKDLGIEQDVEKAIHAAARGNIKHIDIASVNGNYFVNNSSIGVYPRSLVVRESMQRRLGKWPAALYGIARTLVRFRTYGVTIDGKSIRTPFVFIGNNDYRLDRAGLGNRSRLDSGKLCVYVVDSVKQWSLVRLFVKSLLGTLRADHELILYSSTSLTVESKRRRMHVAYDGEVATCTPTLTYELHAGKLKILK